jgi:peptide/nickel transport system substrate-binding protein
MSHVYSGLLRLKIGGGTSFTDRTLEGALAAKWEQPDPQTVVFKLRPGVKFHNKAPVNGRELTSADVKFSMDRLLSSSFTYLNYYSSVGSIETPDTQTATLKLKAPDVALLSHLGIGFTWIIAREAGKSDSKGIDGLNFSDPATAIGTGPFMLESYDRTAKTTFVRNPDYFEPGLPYLDRIEYQLLPDQAAQVAVLQSGQAMLGTLPAGSEGDFRARNSNLIYEQNPSTTTWMYNMRVDQKPFSDVRVRRAMAMAYDQDSQKKTWGTPDTPSTYGSLTAINGDAYLPLDQLGTNAQWWKLDPQGAKQLLATAGYPNGLEADLNTSSCCGATYVEEQFAAAFAKAGVKVNIKIKDHPAFLATTARGMYDGIGAASIQAYDPGDWFTSALNVNSPANYSHVDDPMAADLTAKQRAELDPRKRLDTIHELVRYLAGQVYYLVLPQSQSVAVHQPYLKNYSSRLGYQPMLSVAWLDR